MGPIRQPSLWMTNVRTAALLDQKANLARAEAVAITGQRIDRPSDDPAAWPEVHDLEARIERQRTFRENGDRASNLLIVADESLGMAEDLLTRAHGIAIQGASETLNPDDRISLADQVDDLLEQLIVRANTSVAGQYLFGGAKNDAPPFDATGTYVGDAFATKIDIATGVSAQVGFDGSTTLDPAMRALEQLSLQMRTGTAADVGGTIDQLETSRRELVTTRATTGLIWNKADDALTVGIRIEESLTARHAKVLGADPIEAYTDLAQLRTVYEAALQVSSSARMPSLFDIMG